jgi:anthranilate phosphoribosyltransferase
MMLQDAIKKVTSGIHLTVSESTVIFNEIMEGKATDAQIAAFIIGLKMKGETPEEITGAATVMRDKATHILPLHSDFVVDTCGTGGDGAHTFNISTAAAFVTAGAGATVAKHGNRSVSSKCGSADVLEALGVDISVDESVLKDCLDDIGICFLFAPSLHNAMKYAIGPRREIGVRTIFNILGPLTNPANANNQLLGVFSPALTIIMATVLKNLGSNHAYVVHGADHLDEISLTTETNVAELLNGTIKTYVVKPEDFGFARCSAADLVGGDIQSNASIITDIFHGAKGPKRDIVLLNAGFAIAASGIAKDPKEGIILAEKSIDSGAAKKKLAMLVAKTNAEIV